MPAAASRIHLSIRRIGPRLISSHLLAGLIPFCLAGLFLLLSGALYLATYRGIVALRALREQSELARDRIERAILATGEAPRDPFGSDLGGQAVLVREGGDPGRTIEGSLRFPPDSLLSFPDSSARTPLLWDGHTLFLRARCETRRNERALRVDALVPIDSTRMGRISRLLGEPVRVMPNLQVVRGPGGIQIGAAVDSSSSSAGSGDQSRAGGSAGAIGPPGSRHAKITSGAIAQCLRWNGARWSRTMIPVISDAGFGEQILSLIRMARDNTIATLALIALAFLAALFLGALWVATAMVLDMGRSVTRAVRALTTATAAVGQGNLDHRISVEGQDELWSVAASFNQMAEGLARVRSIERETQRLEEELRLARAIQDRLLPSAPPVLEHAELAGVSLPAREVGGDYFDYLVLGNGKLGIAVADVSGKGAPAALLMSSFRASLRSQDLAALGPGEVLARINRFIHSSIDPGRFITAFLGLLDTTTGEFRYANAGHDAPLVVRPDGTRTELTGGGLILGMLPQIVYDEATAILEPGSLVAIYTDGVTEARDPQGGFYGDERLADVLRDGRAESCQDLLQHVVQSIQSFNATAAQSDDITLVLIRRR